MFLTDLNDDCLYILSEYLDTIDHISLFHTCQHLKCFIHNFYKGKDIILDRTIWEYCHKDHGGYFCVFIKSISQQLRKVKIPDITIFDIHFIEILPVSKITQLFVEELYEIYENETEYHDQLVKLRRITESVCLNLETMDVDLKSFYWLKHLHGLIYPKVTELFWYDRNSDVKIVEEIFPNVNNLTFRCLYGFPKLKYVTQLKLINSYHLTSEELEYIFSSLPLKKLTLDYHSLGKPFLHHISKCQTLEEFHCESYCGNHFSIEDLIKMKSLRRISFNTNYMFYENIPIHSNIVWKTLHLDTINYVFEELQKPQYEQNLKNITRLYYACKWTNKWTKEFLKIFQKCENIKFLDISGNSANIELLKLLLDICHTKTGKQHEIIIRCKNTEIQEEEVKKLVIPHFVKIFFKKNLISPKAGVHCDWINNEN